VAEIAAIEDAEAATLARYAANRARALRAVATRRERLGGSVAIPRPARPARFTPDPAVAALQARVAELEAQLAEALTAARDQWQADQDDIAAPRPAKRKPARSALPDAVEARLRRDCVGSPAGPMGGAVRFKIGQYSKFKAEWLARSPEWQAWATRRAEAEAFGVLYPREPMPPCPERTEIEAREARRENDRDAFAWPSTAAWQAAVAHAPAIRTDKKGRQKPEDCVAWSKFMAEARAAAVASMPTPL
jgi:hypothetical protein